ncbi:MAG: hypothetical protein GPJ54_04635, partial [Candidatus Heimdallarchaeota archaeon]|nr:hypothetical protein [Candidatus Heimdallarchaeota archaeon]
PINTSSTKQFGRLTVSFGDGSATEIDVTGPKGNYTLNNGTETYAASFDAINLVRVSGSFDGEKVTPFNSESDKTAGTASVGGLVERIEVDFFYSASLIIVSYPEWNGQDIIHDPDYIVNYAPNPSEVPTTSDPTTSTETSSPITTTTVETFTSTKDDDDGDAKAGFLPGFGLFIAVFSLVIIVRTRKR